MIYVLMLKYKDQPDSSWIADSSGTQEEMIKLFNRYCDLLSIATLYRIKVVEIGKEDIIDPRYYL